MNPYTSRRRPARLIAFFATVLLSLTASGLTQPAQATTAGTPDTAFNAQFLPAPILENTVNTTVVASDGSVFVGGRFTGGLKKLNADGSLNTAFNTNVANSLFGCEVLSIALTAGGSPIVGCGYNSNNVYLNKFNINGTIDSTFAANVSATANGIVFDVVVSNSGEIYAGGFFPGYLKKFSINGTPDTAFNGAVGSSLDYYVMDLLEMPDGSILAAGDFTNRIKKFNSDGTTTAPAAAFNTSVTGAILFQARALALTTDGSILVGTQGGANLYKINSDGTSTGTAATFNTNIGSSLTDFVDAIQVLSDGSIVIGGRFTENLKKLNNDGSTTGTAATFNRVAAGFLFSDVIALAIGSSDRLYVGGGFGEKLISFNSDGSRTGATGAFNAIVSHQPVGELEVLARSGDGGFFAGGYVSGRIMKFASDGSPDSTFNTNVIGLINAVVRAIAVKCDGSSLVGGDFTNHLKMFNADGTTTGVAATFNTNVASVLDGYVRAVAVLADGSVVVGGDFTNRLMMFNADGTTTGVAATFNTNVGSSLNGRVYEISLTSDGSVMVGGDFTNRMKMFNADGTTTGTAATFNTNMGSINGRAFAIALTSDGSVLVGSEYTPYLKKLNADGTGDVSFNSNVTDVFNNDVNTISLANDGSMILGGEFTYNVKKLNADGTNATGDAATFNAGITAQSRAQVNQDVESSLLMSDGGVIVVGVSNVNNGSRPTVAKFVGAGFPVTTTPGGGSCGSGGGSSGESSSDSTPLTPSTPVVRVPAVLGPVPLGTSTLPPSGVTPGSSVLLVNGVPQSVTVKPDAPVTSQAKGLVAAGDGFTLKLAGVDDRGQSLGVTNDAALVLRRDNSALVEGTGFAPNTDVQVYMFSQPRLLGTVRTNSTGSFSGLVPVPADLAIGPHTMQINALNTDGTVRSLSLGVVLQAPKVAANQKIARASVVFDAGSARLSPQAKKALTTLARRAGATATGGMVVGYVQRDRNYASDEQLSIQRAKSVAKFLRLRGVKGTLVTRGNGALSESETARKAVVTVRYTV
jgi:uncharacterized delta-60 repeat protein